MTMQFEGISNFRDMGGIETKDGRTVKKGLLFRSGQLGDATEADLEKLKALRLACIFDYRDEEEAKKSPTPHIDGVQNMRVPAIASKSAVKVNDLFQMVQSRTLDELTADFATFYTTLSLHNPSYHKLLAQFQTCEGPLLHHCTAGKDRTGIGAALMYLLLGVDEQKIIDEYMLTNKANEQNPPLWYRRIVEKLGGIQDERLELLIGVRPAYLEAVFQSIQQEYGDYNTYFEREYNLDGAAIERLKAFYLQ